MFGLQDIYEGHEVRTQGGQEQAGSSSSTNETERKWQDQVDGLSDKRRKEVKKTVHFGGVRRIPEENEEVEELEEKTVTTLSLSVQVPTAGGKTMGEKGCREQSSMSQLLEKLRRAAEVFADPKGEDEVCKDEKGVEAKERLVRKVESIFKKPHMAAGKLTLSERKWEEKNVVEQNELFNENRQVEGRVKSRQRCQSRKRRECD